MARRCGCASDQCSCTVVAGDGIQVSGAGSPSNPYQVASIQGQIQTGVDIQKDNVAVINQAHKLDFRGANVSVSPGTDEAIVTVTVPDPTTGALIPAGAIMPYAGVSVPTGWLLCDGKTDLVIATYPTLAGVLGTRYGGDGTTTFGVPDLRDRFIIGASATKTLGGTPGGSATKVIGTTNLPPHSHAIDHNHAAANTSSSGTHQHDLIMSTNDGSGNQLRRGGAETHRGAAAIVTDGAHIHSVDLPNFVGSSGQGPGAAVPLDVMPPWLALAYIIKT